MNRAKFQNIITELCEELDIKVKKLSYNWIMELSKNGKVYHILGSKFDLNPDAASNIASDKYATYEVLKSQNVPIIKHVMVFNPEKRRKYTSGFKNKLIITKEKLKHKNLVVKPNNGSEGMGVCLCKNIQETKGAIENLFIQGKDSVSICPYYNIKTEYRVFYLKGEVLLIYGKEKPYVIGDGRKNVSELIKEIKLPDNNVTKENLKNIDMKYIPKKGEKYYISWKHNLSGGARATILEEGELHDRIKGVAIAAGKAINAGFMTIDIIQTIDDKIYVIEINSSIGGTIFTELIEDGYEKGKNIYRRALKALFEQ